MELENEPKLESYVFWENNPIFRLEDNIIKAK